MTAPVVEVSSAPARGAQEPAIVYEHLRVIYPPPRRGEPEKVAVRDLSFTVAEGEVFGFLGPNGAGKTTSMNVLLGFVRPTSGRATIYGLDVREESARQSLGYLPELTYYYKFLTAREILRFYARLFDLPNNVAEKRANELIALVELEHAADKPIRGYSKGMQQRVGLAQALINNPKLLVLDEPTSGLDPLGRMKVRKIIQRLKDEGKTVLFSSHELGEVETVCNRVAILSKGELKEIGPVAELVQRYRCDLEQIFLKVVGEEEHQP